MGVRLEAGANTGYANFLAWEIHRPDSVVPENRVYKEQLQNPLLQELQHFETNWQKEGLPRNWKDLPGIGFMIQAQMGYLKGALTPTDTSSMRDKKISNWLIETEADIKGFRREYLSEDDLVYPSSLTIERRGGRDRVINTLHGGGKLLEETISAKERNGVVRQTFLEKFEPFFLSAPNGSIAVMVSPSGWSGMTDEKGSTIVFPHSHTFIWQKRGSNIEGFAIQTDFTNKEHRVFLKKLGKQVADDAPVTDYISSIGFFRADEKDLHGISEIRDVIDTMRDARFEESVGSLYAYKNHLWKDVYGEIENEEKLWEVDEKTQAMIADFKHFAHSQSWDYETLQKALAVTILRISKHMRWAKQEPKQFSKGGDDIFFSISLGDVFEDVRNIPGCAGGGLGKRQKGFFYDSLLQSVSTTDMGKNESGICNDCGKAEECGVCASCDGLPLVA